MTLDTQPLQLRFRLMLGRAVAVGPGKAGLLAAIADTGSIAAAGRSMGLSYKRAWYLLDTMNRCFREPLAQATKGRKGHGGARLTPLGERVLRLYRSIEAHAAAARLAALAALTAGGADSRWMAAETPVCSCQCPYWH